MSESPREARTTRVEAQPGAPVEPVRSRHRPLWASWPLRLRLTFVAALLFGVALAAGATMLSSVVSHGRIAVVDDVLGPDVRTLAQLAMSDQLPDPLPVTAPGEIAQLLNRDGGVLATSASASRTLPVLPTEVFGDLTSGDAQRSATSAVAIDPTAVAGETVFATTDRSVYGDGLVRVALVPTTWHGGKVWAAVALPLTEVEGVVGALRVSLGVIVPVLTLVLGLVMWTLLGRALRPVEALRRGAEQVTERGGPGTLPVPDADDELGALARTLNSMLDRLDVSASRQRAFVADAAHELRSPVAALRVSIDIAREHPAAYSSAELAADLGSEVARLQALVEDLLVLARLGAVPLVRTKVDVRVLVDEVVASSVAGARASAWFTTDLPVVEVHGQGSVEADRIALGRVVRNLVDNALRHAERRVAVTVSDTAVLVEDDGPGLAPGDRERVFERFTRLEQGRQRDAGGSGLGLSIAREVARENGGDVRLDEADGGGLRATVTMGSSVRNERLLMPDVSRPLSG